MNILPFFLIFLCGCTGPQNKTQEQRSTQHPLLRIDGLSTTAHTTDGTTHLQLNATSATRDSHTKTLTAQSVRAHLTHRSANTLHVSTPAATWDECTNELKSDGAVVLTHHRGTLFARAGGQVSVPAHRLHMRGPVIHRLTL